MRILVLGGDGFLGWPTALHLAAAGHQVGICDSGIRRLQDRALGVASVQPIASIEERLAAAAAAGMSILRHYRQDITDPAATAAMLADFRPEAVVHMAEQCSAPYSMRSAAAAIETQGNNVLGTLALLWGLRQAAPNCHLVKLGTMGEYGTPNIDIEEGFIEITHHGRRDVLPYPKQPGSFYHLSKVHDSHNIQFCCRVWGLAATDLNQGVVYGVETAETAAGQALATRFSCDDIFGTVLNRFVAQAAVGADLTVYGRGGQTRGLISIVDVVAAVALACEHPAQAGQYRVFNQFTEQWSVADLAELVAARARVAGLHPVVAHLQNPRVEAEDHYYNAAHTKLEALGLVPHPLTPDVVDRLLAVARAWSRRIDGGRFRPRVPWR